MACDLPVTPSGPENAAAARALAERWGLCFALDSEAPLRLVLTLERLELRRYGPEAPGPVFVDFVGGAVGHRRLFGGGRGQPIAKAAGLKAGALPRILDATAGLGRDAFVYASLGCEVTLLERSPVVAALLEDGLRRASREGEVEPIVRRMRLVAGEAVEYMERLIDAERPDVVYLDPMFPHREKSARVKKEMHLLQQLLGADEEEGRLLDTALTRAKGRVVVKRPAGAPPLARRRPTLSFMTKSHRFDVYVIKALPGGDQETR